MIDPDLEELSEAGRKLMNECIYAEEGSIYKKAYDFWVNLHVPGIMEVEIDEENAINHAILSAFIAGYTLRLTGEEQEDGTS